MRLPPGKIPIDILREVVFKNLGAERKDVVVGPSSGIDGAVLDAGGKSLIVSMDPITGAVERIGWLAINVNANDIATFGVEPSFFFSCIMLPEKGTKETVEVICKQMDAAARELGIAIVGGHCESTPGIQNPIVVGCTMGFTEKGNYVTASGAKAGDRIILTKSAAIEGTAILASDKQQELSKIMNPSMLADAKDFYKHISVVRDALIAYRTGGVHAMHDPTEGGVAGGIHEMADASHLGVKILEDKIVVEPETAKICRYFEIDPLQLIGSGALLISSQPEKADKIIGTLGEAHIYAATIGEFHSNINKRVMTRKDGSIQDLPRPSSDHLWAALAH